MRLISKTAAGLDAARAPVVAALAAIGVRPNHLTVLGAVISGAAGYAAALGALPLAGAVFLAGSLLDAFDGALARRTGRVSVFGAFFDSLLDRVGEGLLLLGVLVHFTTTDNDLGAVLAFVALLTSLLVSYARARAEGLGLRGAGGVSPRPVRVAVLVAGLLLSQVTVALGVVAILSTASVVQRAVGVGRQTREG